MSPNGTVLNEAQVNNPTDPAIESSPDIAILDNGFIVVSWTFPYNPSVDNDIYYRIFNPSGLPVTIDRFSGVRVLDASTDNDVASAVSSIFAGQFIAAWQDSKSDTSAGQITASVHELVRTTTGDNTSESLVGDALRDSMFGNGGNDTLAGGAADDALRGGIGSDVLNGGVGIDTAIYSVSNASVVVNLATGSGNGGHAQGDKLGTIENVIASNFNDVLTGNGIANNLQGGSGHDQLVGGNENDTLDGGIGVTASSEELVEMY